MSETGFSLAAAMREALRHNPAFTGPEALTWIRKQWPEEVIKDKSLNAAYNRAKKKLGIPVRGEFDRIAFKGEGADAIAQAVETARAAGKSEIHVINGQVTTSMSDARFHTAHMLLKFSAGDVERAVEAIRGAKAIIGDDPEDYRLTPPLPDDPA